MIDQLEFKISIHWGNEEIVRTEGCDLVVNAACASVGD